MLNSSISFKCVFGWKWKYFLRGGELLCRGKVVARQQGGDHNRPEGSPHTSLHYPVVCNAHCMNYTYGFCVIHTMKCNVQCSADINRYLPAKEIKFWPLSLRDFGLVYAVECGILLGMKSPYNRSPGPLHVRFFTFAPTTHLFVIQSHIEVWWEPLSP